jgi:hypothetical protein
MTDLEVRILNAIRRRIVKTEALVPPAITLAGQSASNAIRSLIEGEAPAMVSRFGSTELGALIRYDVRSKHGKEGVLQRLKYIFGRIDRFYYDTSQRQAMENMSGFFPTDDDALDRFGARVLNDAREVNILGSWLADESRLSYLFPKAEVCTLAELEPYFHGSPWTVALEGRRVLVIHPFAKTIESQYRDRQGIWAGRDVLPAFDLVTLKTAMTIAGQRNGYASWFDALEEMESKVSATNFDVALIGAGAYGFPLAAHVKRLGRKAIHLGGALQILFGIRGARWDSRPDFQRFFNEHWVRPPPEERPLNAEIVEGACYW